MPIDSTAFLETSFVPREAEIPVPGLQPWSDDGGVPVWKVRGLTGQQWWKCKESVDNRKDIVSVISNFIGGDSNEVTAALKERFCSESASDLAFRIEILILASIDPVCNREMAAKVCKYCLAEFKMVTEEIIKLSWQGHLPGKPKPSGEDRT